MKWVMIKAMAQVDDDQPDATSKSETFNALIAAGFAVHRDPLLEVETVKADRAPALAQVIFGETIDG